MGNPVNLFYLSSNTTGGWVTYTAHLMYGLKSIGVEVNLYKVGNRTESRSRPFGYDSHYTNLSLEDSLNVDGHSVIVALQKNFREKSEALMDNGAYMVVHDPAEFKNIELNDCSNYITIRKEVRKKLKGSRLVYHPYKRRWKELPTIADRKRVCSISRIDFDKNTDILLRANRVLKSKQRISIHGFENRLYTKFKLLPEFPEWEQSKSHYPRERFAATDICKNYMFAVDMSVIKGDGGGTQYSFLEAMDAGCVPIVHIDWIIPNDEMVPWPNPKANCIAVEDSKQLVRVIESTTLKAVKTIRNNCDKLLDRHKAGTIAKKFVKVLGK